MRKLLYKRMLSLVLSAALLFSQTGITAFAANDNEAEYIPGTLCEHHTEHDDQCGYVEGADCTHAHTEDCYHTETVCTVTDSGKDAPADNTATPPDAPEPTEHECTVDSGCVKEVLDCAHENGVHGETCGYTAATPCDYVCEICSAPKDSSEADNVAPGVSSITVTAFDELAEEVQQQTVPAGTELDALSLPDTLTATGYIVAEDTEVLDSGTPSDAEPAPDAITIAGVEWELDPENEINIGIDTYDPTQGSYAFTPVLPSGYTLAEGVALPEIWVAVGLPNLMASRASIYYVDADGSRKTAENATSVTNATSEYTDGWYYVPSNTSNIRDGTITVKGNVNLILEDGSTWMVNAHADKVPAVNVPDGNSLTIYGQSGGTGTLDATGGAKGDAAGIGSIARQVAGEITINGGIIKAKGGQWSAAIGGGLYGTGGTITINGGSVIADGNIGVLDGNSGTFSTGTNGNAFILATSVSDKSQQGNWKGVIIEGNSGTVYGSPVLQTNAEVPNGKTLTIASGKTLTIDSGKTLTNSGTINISSGGALTINNGGTLINNGTLVNKGTIVNSGTLTNSGTLNNYGTLSGTEPSGGTINNPSQVVVTFGIKNGNSNVNAATYGDTVTITATAGAKTVTNVLRTTVPDTVDFYLGSVADENKLNNETVNVSNGTATLEVTLESEKWKPAEYTIWAVYGGSTGLIDSTGSATLTVSKADQTTPAAPTSGTVSISGGTATVELPTVNGQAYIYTTENSAPATNTGNWTTATGTTTNFTNLTIGTTYYFWTHIPGDDYKNPSTVSGSLQVDAIVAPAITAHPGNKDVVWGNTASFSVAATGGDLSYQWQVDTGNGWSDVTDGSGGQTATYTTPVTTMAMNGYKYQCVITNDAGNATSSTATLIVKKKAQLTVNLPTQNSKTATTVTLTASTGGSGNGALTYGYATTNSSAGISNWQSALTFSGLSPNTTYYFFSKKAADTQYNEAISSSLSVKTEMGDQSVTTAISYGKTTFTYGDAAQTLGTTPVFSQTGTIAYTSSNELVLTVANDGTITIVGVGTATITATNTVANYENATSAVTITVSPATPTITWPTASGITYGAALSTSGLTGGSSNGSFAWSDDTVVPTVSNSGYDVVFTPADTDNYDYSGVEGWDSITGKVTKKVSITVNPATPSITWPTASGITYGAALSTTTLTGGSNNGGFAWSVGTTVPTVSNSGYDVVFTPADTDNYDYSGVEGWNSDAKTVTKKVSVTVSPATLTVTAKNHTITYGALPANDGVEYSGFVNSEDETDLTGSLAYEYSYTQYGNVGNAYTITPKGYEDGNYTISYATGTLTVEQKEVGLTWENISSRKYGDGKTVTATATGTVNNDTLNVTVTGGNETAVGGTYTATATGLTGAKAGNYKLPAGKTATYSIGKADALSLAGSAVMIKNQSDYKVELDLTKVSSYPATPGGAPTFTVTSNAPYNGLTSAAVNGSTLTLTANNTTNSTDDTVTVTVSGMNNYADSTITITVSYTEKTTVTITGVTEASGLVYNGAAQAGYTGTPSSNYNGEYVISYESTDGGGYGPSATAPTNAGSYKVTISVPADNATYTGSKVLNFTIAKKAVTVKPENKSAKQGDSMPSFNLVYDGLIGSEALTPSATPAFSCDANMDVADTYTITWSNMDDVSFTGNVAKNYEIAKQPTGTLTVAQTLYTVTISGGGDGATVSGEYASGTTVNISAGTKSGYTFNGWTGDVAFTDKNNASTTFTMPEKDVTVTAAWRSNGGGGSTGGGGGGGSDNDNSGNHVTTTTDPTKPNSPTTGEITIGKPDNDGNAKVPSGQITSAIDKATKDAQKNGSTENGIAITVKLPDGATSASLDRTALNKLISEGVKGLTLDFPNTNMTFDLPALKELAAKTNGTVTFAATKATGLTGDALATIGTRPVYQLTVSYQSGGKTMYITNFGKGSVSVALNYTPTAAEQNGSLYAVYVDDKGKVEWLDNSSYDRNAKTVRFATSHFSVFGIGYKAAPTFTDVSNHWAKDDIAFVVSRGILTGTGKTTFSPGDSMTRGMFVTALGRLAGIAPEKYTNTKFTDVTADAYYAPYTAWATEKGITTGTTATTFSPDKSITRQEMAVFMQNYAKAMGYTLPKTREAVTFADNASVGSWAANAVKAMQVAGIINGKDGNRFDPQGTATRAEVSAVLRRYVELVIDPATAQGLTVNDSGSAMMYESGKAVKSASRKVDNNTYHFNANGEAALPPTKKTGTYIVQKGDSFSLIASKVGCTMAELEVLNGKSRYDTIYAGQVLKVPQA